MIGTAKDGGLISRAVREALGTLVSPQICEQLITRSLRTQGLSAIPESGTQIGEWLEAGLRPEVENVVGSDAADLVMMQLGPIAAYAAISVPKQSAPKQSATKTSTLESTTRRKSSLPPRRERERDPFASDEPDRPTDLRLNPGQTDWSTFDLPSPPPEPHSKGLEYESAPPTGKLRALGESIPVATLPPARPVSDKPDNDVAFYTARPQAPDNDKVMSQAPGTLPAVLAATSDMGDFEALRRYLGSTAQVAHIPDLVGLLDALDEEGLVEPIVLIDCQRPTVHTTSVAALGEDLPRGTTIVLWGADENTWAQVDRDRSPGCRWVRCSREASTSDVGSLCAMLIG